SHRTARTVSAPGWRYPSSTTFLMTAPDAITLEPDNAARIDRLPGNNLLVIFGSKSGRALPRLELCNCFALTTAVRGKRGPLQPRKSCLQECQQIGVDCVGLRRRHAMG